MGIRGKLLGSLLCLLGALALGMLGLLRVQMLHNYAEIEIEHAQSDMHSVIRALESENTKLAVLADDWGHWTELYDFAAGRNPGFAQDNFSDSIELYQRSGINWLAIANKQGQLLIHLGLEPHSGARMRFPTLESADIGLKKQWVQLAQGHGRCGLVQVTQGPMLLCASSILTSAGEGPSQGIVIFGRLLDKFVLEAVRQRTNREVALLTAQDHPLQKELGKSSRITSPLGDGEVRYVEENGVYKLYWALRDLNGQAMQDVVLTWPRDMRAQAERMLRMLTWQLGILAALIALGMGLVVELLLVRRLKKLDSELNQISSQRNWRRPVSMSSNDEIGALTTHVNELLVVIQEQVTELETSAMTDELTGLANRRAFDQHLAEEIRRQLRHGQALSLVMCDVDCFKRFNDRYGHQAGDVALQSIARCLKNGARRSGDLPVRLGGEEFALLLIATDITQALHIANEVRQTVEALAIPHENSEVAKVVTLSFGVSELRANDSPGALYARADAALYEAKRAGRNCGVAN